MPGREFLYMAVPGTTASRFLELYGTAFIDALSPENTLEDGTLMIRSYDASHPSHNVEWDHFCVKHQVYLSFDICMFRSLAGLGDDLYSILVEKQYNHRLGELNFTVRPGLVSPITNLEYNVEMVSVEFECTTDLSVDSVQPLVRVMREWCTLQHSVSPENMNSVHCAGESGYIDANRFTVFVNLRSGGMMSVVLLLSQMLQVAYTIKNPTIRRVQFCGRSESDVWSKKSSVAIDL